MKKEQFVLGFIVSNQFGVLYRIAGLFTTRGYNIDRLTVGETSDPQFSRMTVVTTGGTYEKQQIVRQLQKLHDVKRIEFMDDYNGEAINIGTGI